MMPRNARLDEDQDIDPFADEELADVKQRRGAFASRNPGRRNQSIEDEAIAIERSLKRRSRVIPLTVAALALLGFGAAIWFAYSSGLTSDGEDDVVIIKAESTPEKVKPTDEGGLEVPHQDKLLLNEVPGAIGESEVEQLLPPPETPLLPESLPGQAEGGDGQLAEGSEAQSIIDEMARNIPEVPATSSAPEDAVVSGTAPADVPSTAAEVEEAPSATPAEPGAGTQAGEAETVAAEEASPAAPSDSESSGTNTPPPPASKPASKSTQTAALPKSGDYVLQLSSVNSQSGAERGWARMQGAQPDLLGDMGVTIQAADVNGKTYYRILTGPFPNRATAADMCAQLKARNQDCLVKRL